MEKKLEFCAVGDALGATMRINSSIPHYKHERLAYV